VSRLNLNSIRSWVDSHIIDYPTAMLKLKNARMFILVFFVSLYLLFFVSPVFGIILLLIFTLYLLYNKKYKNIFLIWGSFFFIWYLVFTACLIGYDGPILFIPDFFNDGNKDYETFRLLLFLNERYSSSRITQSLFNFNLESFCIQTFFILWRISLNLKVTIYLPSLLKGILGK